MVAPKSTPNFGNVKIALTIVDISRKIAKTHNYKHMSFYDCSFTQYFLSRQDPSNLARISSKALYRYRLHETQRQCPVVLALGAGGSPKDPDIFTIVSINQFINSQNQILIHPAKLSPSESTDILMRSILEFEC